MSRTGKTKAFTLLEMMIAMTITAITGLAVAAATVALTRAHQETEGFYRSLQTARSAMLRIQRTVQGSKLITASTTHVVVLWFADINENRRINAEEVMLLIFDPNDREIRVVHKVFPEAVRDAMNVEVLLDTLTSVGLAKSEVLPSPYAQTTVLASDATDFCALTTPGPPLATRVDILLSVGSGRGLVTLRSSAAPRGPKTAQVEFYEGEYILRAD